MSSSGQCNKSLENPPVFRQYLTALICSILAFMYGNSIGWSSSAVIQLENGVLSSGPVQKTATGWVGGSFCIGALISSPFHGLLADVKGRKFAAYLVAFGFVINWGIMLGATSYIWVLVARAFAGAAGAGSITVVSIYNSEIAEPKLRSTLGGMMSLLYGCGIFCAYILGSFTSFSAVAWVYLIIGIIWIPLWIPMHESPAHLILHGREKEGLEALQWILGTEGGFAKREFDRLKQEQAGAVKAASVRKFFSHPEARKGITYCIGLVVLQTFCGIFAIHSYASSIFSRAGGGLTPAVGTTIYGLFMVAGGVVPPLLADRAPRKVLLTLSSGLLGLGMSLIGTYQFLKYSDYIPDSDTSLGWLPATILSCSVFVYYFGLGSVVYITMNELFSDENRGVAGSIIALCIWATSFILLQFFELAVEVFGDYTVFYFFSTVCALGMVFILIFLPETRGKSIQEIQTMLSDK